MACAMHKKRAIPKPPAGDMFASAVKENLEIIQGLRGSAIDPLAVVGERWKDLLCEITTRTTGAGTPAYNTFNGGPQRAYQFVLNDEVYTEVHIPHDWKIGTPIYLHVHWAGSNTNTGTVTWDLAWQYARGYGRQAFSASQTVQVTQAHCGIAFGHNIAEMSEAQAILPDQCETDGIVLVATKLSAKAYTGNVFAFFIDVHYQSDGVDTTSRNPIVDTAGNGMWIKNYAAYSCDSTEKINEIIEVLQ